MRGERLTKANEIAKKRARRRSRTWSFPDQVVGKYRKWNQTCSCPACKKLRYKSKSNIKRRYIVDKTQRD
jgi:hypothetical protein